MQHVPYWNIIGGLWIVIGSIFFFGTIVSVITSYFMRPLQRPKRKIVDAIVAGLEELDELTTEEQDLLESAIDSLFTQMHKQRTGKTH